MTTTITVKANHGWPVKVTTIDPETDAITAEAHVEAGETRDFHAHSRADLRISEIQPEVDAKASEAA